MFETHMKKIVHFVAKGGEISLCIVGLLCLTPTHKHL